MNLQPTTPLLSALVLSLLTLSACGGADDTTTVAEPSFAPLSQTIAHVNDHHSQQAPFADTTRSLDGTPTRVELGGFARVTSAFQRYTNQGDVIKLHAGDAITGALYYSRLFMLGFMALQWPPDHPALAGMGLTTAATGWARVYAGAHFPLDVAAGLALGGVSGWWLAWAF